MTEKITTPQEAVKAFNEHKYLGHDQWLVGADDSVRMFLPDIVMAYVETYALPIANALCGYYDAIESERNALQSEVDRMKPVMKAAIELRESGSLDSDYQPDVRLMITVDAFKKKSVGE